MSFSEVWLDQILSRKLSVKRFMDTRTPFDISRLDEGKKKEVTEEHFSGSTKSEETKSEETKNEERSDNEDRTNEELFFDEEELQELQQQEIFASEATLVEWFAEADQGRKGFLSSSDFISIVNKRAGDLGLTDDEIANAVLLSKMSTYARGGKPFYSVAEASQDRYLDLLIAEAAETGQTVTATQMPWADHVRRPDLPAIP